MALLTALVAAKALGVLSIAAVTAAGLYAPFYLTRRHGDFLLHLCHSIVGGTFLGAALLHLIPDAAGAIPLATVLAITTLGVLFADVVESLAAPVVAAGSDAQ